MSVELKLGEVRWTDEQLEARVQEIIAGMSGTGGGFDCEVLYENLDLTSNYTVRQIELTKSVYDYKFLIIVTVASTSNAMFFSTGLVSIKSISDKQIWVVCQGFVYSKGVCQRSLGPVAGDPTKLTVTTGGRFTSFTGAVSQDDSVIIPYRVYGVK